MEMAENPKLVLGLEETTAEMGTPKISVSDHIYGLQYAGDKSDNIVIDMDSFPGRDVPANPRISRNLSRKGSHRGAEEKIIPNSNPSNSERNDKDSALPSPSPRAAANGPDRLTAGAIDHGNGQQIHHQITITTANISSSGESRCVRRNSFRRSSMSPSWILDPKRILLIFATLSSIGTIMLIYFTLSIGKSSDADGAALDS